MLQEYIEGFPMSIGGWFDGKKFLRPILPNFEDRTLLEGDIGPNVGRMGATVIYKDKNRLFTETLDKAAHVLAAEGYVGFVNLSCIVSEGKPYALSWDLGLDMPAVVTQYELLKGDVGAFLMGVANASMKNFKTRKNNWCVGIPIMSMPWPLKYRNMPILIDSLDPHIHYQGIKMKEDHFVTAGNNACVALIAGHGREINAASQYASQRANRFKVMEGYHRSDAGLRVMTMLPLLKSWGFLSK